MRVTQWLRDLADDVRFATRQMRTSPGFTIVATMTLALAAGATFEGAARLANYAGGIVVMKRGTATVSDDELRAAVRDQNSKLKTQNAKTAGKRRGKGAARRG